jgi:hypothetical protein
LVSNELEQKRTSHHIVRKVAAGAVLVVAGVIAVHLLFSLVMTVVYVALAIALIVAVVWAVNALF